MSSPRVLVADDHVVVSEGLRRLLEPEFDVFEDVRNGRALVEAVQETRPDLIVADISLPLLNGIDAARQILKANPQAKIVFFSMHSDPTYVHEALEAGGLGYVLKTDLGGELATALRDAMQGKVHLSPAIAKLMGGAERPRKTNPEMTPREREVLQLVAEGRTFKEIAHILHISPKTVEFHRYRISEKLGLHTTAELIQFAFRHGIVAA